MTKTNVPEIYMLHNSTQKSIKDLNLSKLLVDSVVNPAAEWVDTGHSETELTIYISMADSVKFRWSPELFLGWLCKLLFIPGIIRIPSTAYYSRNYLRTIGSGLPETLIEQPSSVVVASKQSGPFQPSNLAAKLVFLWHLPEVYCRAS